MARESKRDASHGAPTAESSHGVAALIGGLLLAWALFGRRRVQWTVALSGAALVGYACARVGHLPTRWRQQAPEPRADAPNDEVEIASRESFPASDPPSFTPGHP